MRTAFVTRLTKLAEADSKIFLITADLGFGVFENFAKRFPRQFLNVGVAEQNMIGVATGLALEGHIVFVYSIGNFATLRCLEQIRNDAAYHSANVKIVSMGGGFSYGQLGFSHHATEDLSIMSAIPGITMAIPCDTWEAAEATEAIAQVPGTGFLRLDKSSATIERGIDEKYVLSQATTLREGKALTLIAIGGIVGEALGAADELAKRGIDCRALALKSLRPLDKEAILRASQETGGIITLEENILRGGLGSAVAEVLMDHEVFPAAFRRLGLSSMATVVGDQAFLRRHYGIDQKSLVDEVHRLLGAPFLNKNQSPIFNRAEL